MGRQVIRKRKVMEAPDISAMDLGLPVVEGTDSLAFDPSEAPPIGIVLRDQEEVSPEGGDTYTDKILKLIPAETIALYLFVEGILRSALPKPEFEHTLPMWLWITFIAILILNIPYLRGRAKVTDFWQLTIMSVAFLIWVFSMGGPFEYLDFYEPFMGPVFLALFTFAVPNIYKGVDA